MCQRQSGIRRKLLTKELKRRIRTKKRNNRKCKAEFAGGGNEKVVRKNGTGLKAVLPAGCVVWGKVRVCPAPNAGLPGNAASCL